MNIYTHIKQNKVMSVEDSMQMAKEAANKYWMIDIIENTNIDFNPAQPTENHGDPFSVEFPWKSEMRVL